MIIPRFLLSVAFLTLFSIFSLRAEGDWVSLFDGKTLEGWKINERPESWAIEDGAIVTKGERSHLFYVGDVASHDFKNFEFEAEVMTAPGSNSGIYVHTRFQDEGWPSAGYECQVINSNPEGPATYVEHKMTGSIYAVRNVWKTPARDNRWFTYRIKVQGKTIQTFVDGELVCEYTEPENPWRPDDKKGRVLGSGTFAFQAHDPGSITRYRKIRVRLLPDGLPSIGAPLEDGELDWLITEFSNSNHALVDVGIANPSSDSPKALAVELRRYGVTAFDVDLSRAGTSLFVVNDLSAPPSVTALKAAKESGVKIVFSSGGASSMNEARFKERLLAMRQSEIAWEDLWVPGK